MLSNALKLRELFVAGKGALHAPMGTFAMPMYKQQATFNWGLTLVPKSIAGRAIEENAFGWGINPNSRHVDEAWEVIKALVTMSPGTTAAIWGQFSPVRTWGARELGIIEETFGLSQADALNTVNSLQYMRPMLRHPQSAQIISQANSAFMDIVYNGAVPSNRLTQAAERISALLSQ